MPTPHAATAVPTAPTVPARSSRMNAGSSGERIEAANIARPEVTATPRTSALPATWRRPSPSAATPPFGRSSSRGWGMRTAAIRRAERTKVAALTPKATSTSA